MKLLAIDPGLSYTGYAVIERKDSKLILLVADVIVLRQKFTIPQKLKIIYDELRYLAEEHQITDLALETAFLGKNAATFTKLGYIRGLLYLLSETNSLCIHEFAPQVVKKAVTGHGFSDKEDVAKMVKRRFPSLKEVKRSDITDAVAIGLCAIACMKPD